MSLNEIIYSSVFLFFASFAIVLAVSLFLHNSKRSNQKKSREAGNYEVKQNHNNILNELPVLNKISHLANSISNQYEMFPLLPNDEKVRSNQFTHERTKEISEPHTRYKILNQSYVHVYGKASNF